MKSFERVKTALTFSNPDKIPIINFTNLRTIFFQSDVFPLVPMPSKNWQPGWRESEEGLFPFFNTYINLGYKWKEPKWVQDPKYRNWRNNKHEEIDEWGCVWVSLGDNSSMGHPGRPSLPDWGKLDEYMDIYFPNPDENRYKITFLGSKLFARDKYRIVLPSFGPFTIASNMRGFDNWMIDQRRDPDKVKYLMEQITDVIIKMTKTIIRLGGKPHGYWLVDDLGTQIGPYISPELFKKTYQSSYGTLINIMHDLKLDFHHHCCGKIDKLIPILLDWGVDAFELDSPRMTGYPALRQFRGKVMFWCCLNIQSIYIRGTPEQCKQEIFHMLRNLGTINGGFGAYFYPQPKHIQAPDKNIIAFKQGLKKIGKYSKILPPFWETAIIDEWKMNGADSIPPFPQI